MSNYPYSRSYGRRNAYSTVTFYLVGLGGTGGWFAEMLVRYLLQNIKEYTFYRLVLIDDDSVELKNTVRQHFFGAESVGLPKVLHMKAKLDRIIASAIAYATVDIGQELLKVDTVDGSEQIIQTRPVHTEEEERAMSYAAALINDDSVDTIPRIAVHTIQEMITEENIDDVFSPNMRSPQFIDTFGGNDDHSVVINMVDNNYTRRLLEEYWLYDMKKGRTSITPIMRGVQMLMLVRQKMLGRALLDKEITEEDKVCFTSTRKNGATALILCKIGDENDKLTPISSFLFDNRSSSDYSAVMSYLLGLVGNVSFVEWLVGYMLPAWLKGDDHVNSLFSVNLISKILSTSSEIPEDWEQNLEMFTNLVSSIIPDTDVTANPLHVNGTTQEFINRVFLQARDPLYIDAGNSDTSYMINAAGLGTPLIDFREYVYDADLSLPDGMMSCADRNDTETVAQTTSMNVSAAASIMRVIEDSFPKIIKECDSRRVVYGKIIAETSIELKDPIVITDEDMIKYLSVSSAESLPNAYLETYFNGGKTLVSAEEVSKEKIFDFLIKGVKKEIKVPTLVSRVVVPAKEMKKAFALVLPMMENRNIGFLITSTEVGSSTVVRDAEYIEASVSAFMHKFSNRKDEILVKLLED